MPANPLATGGGAINIDAAALSTLHSVAQSPAMPWNDDQAVQALRMTYNAAVSAHAGCSRALTDAALRGERPSPEMVEAEAKARARLDEARDRLHAAMARAAAGNKAP